MYFPPKFLGSQQFKYSSMVQIQYSNFLYYFKVCYEGGQTTGVNVIYSTISYLLYHNSPSRETLSVRESKSTKPRPWRRPSTSGSLSTRRSANGARWVEEQVSKTVFFFGVSDDSVCNLYLYANIIHRNCPNYSPLPLCFHFFGWLPNSAKKIGHRQPAKNWMKNWLVQILSCPSSHTRPHNTI